MASGNKRVQINTRERIVSTDHNRLQAFEGAHVAEIFRWLCAASQDESGAAIVASSTSSPLNAVILNGLCPRPEIGTVNMFVEPGVIGMTNPDAVPNADDSPFKVFADAGVQVAGALTLTAGGGGATRIDVLECSRVEVVTESDNRDVFDPGSALFAPVLVDKVKVDRLTYRIRTGVAGAGFPGTANGWLPLAVAHVPQTATTWNDCIVHDVRPLVADFRNHGGMRSQWPARPKGIATAASVAAATPATSLRGISEVEFGRWKVGGEFASTTADLTGDAIDLDSVDVQEVGFAAVANLPWYVYAMFPHGLPRWARYSPASAGVRVPLPFKGIPVFTQTPPLTGRHIQTSAPITMPAVYGFTATQTSGVPVMTGVYGNGATFMDSSLADGWSFVGGASGITLTLASGSGTAEQIFDMVDNTHIPVGAVAVRLRFSVTITMSNGADTRYTIEKNARALDTTGVFGAAIYRLETSESGISVLSGSVIIKFEVELPIHQLSSMPLGTAGTRQVAASWVVIPHAGTVGFGAATASVIGWRLGVD